jgi:hypothetical protein
MRFVAVQRPSGSFRRRFETVCPERLKATMGKKPYTLFTD